MQYKAIDWFPEPLTRGVLPSNFTKYTSFLNKVLFYSPNHISLYCSTHIHNIQLSSLPEDEDNPLGVSNEIVPHTIVLSPRRWRQSTRRQQQDCSITYNRPLFPKMETIHSKVAIRLLHNIQSSTRSEDGDNPLEGNNNTALQHTCIHMPRRWDFPHSEATTQLLWC